MQSPRRRGKTYEKKTKCANANVKKINNKKKGLQHRDVNHAPAPGDASRRLRLRQALTRVRFLETSSLSCRLTITSLQRLMPSQ